MEQAKLLSFFDNFQATLDNINKNITEIRYRNELTDNSIKENLCQQNKINIDNTNKIDEISKKQKELENTILKFLELIDNKEIQNINKEIKEKQIKNEREQKEIYLNHEEFQKENKEYFIRKFLNENISVIEIIDEITVNEKILDLEGELTNKYLTDLIRLYYINKNNIENLGLDSIRREYNIVFNNNKLNNNQKINIIIEGEYNKKLKSLDFSILKQKYGFDELTDAEIIKVIKKSILNEAIIERGIIEFEKLYRVDDKIHKILNPDVKLNLLDISNINNLPPFISILNNEKIKWPNVLINEDLYLNIPLKFKPYIIKENNNPRIDIPIGKEMKRLALINFKNILRHLDSIGLPDNEIPNFLLHFPDKKSLII